MPEQMPLEVVSGLAGQDALLRFFGKKGAGARELSSEAQATLNTYQIPTIQPVTFVPFFAPYPVEFEENLPRKATLADFITA